MASRRLTGKSLVTPFVGLAAGGCLVLVVSVIWLGQVFAQQRAQAATLSDRLTQTLRLNTEFGLLIDRHLPLLSMNPMAADRTVFGALHQLQYDSSRVVNRYLAAAASVDHREAIEQLREAQLGLAFAIQFAMEMRRANQPVAAAEGVKSALAAKANIDRLFENLGEILLAQLGDALETRTLIEKFPYMAAAGLFFVVILCLAFLLLLRRRVVLPVNQIQAAVQSVGEGDFTPRLEVTWDNEIGWLAKRLNRMIEQLELAHNHLESEVRKRSTELQQTQNQLVQAEKMSALGRLVSGVAHELNNPMTAIGGLAEIVLDELPQDAVEQRNRLHQLLDQCQRSRRIVGDLLQFSRSRETVLEPLDLAAVAGDAVRVFEHSAKLFNAKLTVDFSHTANCFVLGDRIRLQQVLVALLNNALDASKNLPGEPKITLRSGRNHYGPILEILDRGCGLTETQKIFEPFFTTKDVGQGTGLGLSICYGIMHEHGGAVFAANRDGGGARFTLSFPATDRIPQPEASMEQIQSPQPSPADRGQTVLVVDDEPSLLQVQEMFLKRMGLACQTAPTISQARQILQSHTIAAIVADVRMPGAEGGLDLYQWVCRRHADLAQHFVLATGDVFAVEDGAFGQVPVLAKPFDFDTYQRVLQRLLPVTAC